MWEEREGFMSGGDVFLVNSEISYPLWAQKSQGFVILLSVICNKFKFNTSKFGSI